MITKESSMKIISDNELEKVCGGFKPEDIPRYGEVKRAYFEKGANFAFTLFIYFVPSPLGYEAIETIEDEIKAGNLGYTIDGIYYSSPKEDPYFQGKNIL